jgi:hypothetical protein
MVLTRHGLCRPAFWRVSALMWLALTLVMALSMDDRYLLLVRLVASAVYVLPVVAAVVIVGALLTGWVTWRATRRRLVAGSVWTAVATLDEVTMSSPSNVRLTVPHAAWAMVRVRGDWVLTQQRAGALVSAWPRSFFSEETLSRMRSAASR